MAILENRDKQILKRRLQRICLLSKTALDLAVNIYGWANTTTNSLSAAIATPLADGAGSLLEHWNVDPELEEQYYAAVSETINQLASSFRHKHSYRTLIQELTGIVDAMDPFDTDLDTVIRTSEAFHDQYMTDIDIKLFVEQFDQIFQKKIALHAQLSHYYIHHDTQDILALLRQISCQLNEDRKKTDEQRCYSLRLPPVSGLGNGFVGREAKLAEIQQRIDDGWKLIVLSGLGGMGKTELAVRFGQYYTGGAVYYIRFEDSFTHTVAKMAAGIHPELSNDELSRSDEELCKNVLKILEVCGNKDVLIIDNVDSDQKRMSDLKKDDVYRKLTDLDLRLLLTTRFEVGQSVNVARMDDDMLYMIFEKHGASISREEMKALIDAVNGHTLTIDLIARTLADNWEPVTAEEMLTALKNSTLADEEFPEVETYYNQSPEQVQIYQHLRRLFTVAKIPETEQNILRCATLLPQTGMYYDLFRDSLPNDWRSSVASLGRRGWLTKDGELLNIHPMVRLVCREELKPQAEDCESFLAQLAFRFDVTNYDRAKYLQMAELFSTTIEMFQNTIGVVLGIQLWSFLGLEKRAKALYDKYLSDANEPDSSYTNLVNAKISMGDVRRKLGDYDGALKILLEALAILEENNSLDLYTWGCTYNNLGIVCSSRGEYAMSFAYLQAALTIFKIILPSTHTQLAKTFDNLGATFSHMCDWEKAMYYKEKAIEIYENTDSGKNVDLAITYDNLSMDYCSIGKYGLALEYAFKAKTIFESLLPDDHSDLAQCYNNIGAIYFSMGNHSEALKYHQLALGIRTKTHDTTHVNLALSYIWMGTMCYDSNNLEAAIDFFIKAETVYIDANLPHHPHLAHTYRMLRNCYAAIKDYSKAIAYELEAFEIDKLTMQPEDPNMYEVFFNLASLYDLQEDYQNALVYFLKVLDIFRSHLPSDSFDLGGAIHNVGITYFRLKQYPSALEYLTQALSILEKHLPNDDSIMIEAREKIAIIQSGVGDKSNNV